MMPRQIGRYRRANAETDCDCPFRWELSLEHIEDLESIRQHPFCAKSASAGPITAVMKTSHVHRRELPVQAERHALDIPDIAAEPEQGHLLAAALATWREDYAGQLRPVCGGDAQPLC
jgi:hypothetical protein